MKDGRKIIVKRYSGFPGSLKWGILYVHPAGIYYPITGDPLERLLREEDFFTNPPVGVRVPKIIHVDYKRKVMQRELLEGRHIDIIPKDLKLLGEILAKIHESGYRMGDTRLENFILADDGKLSVIDAEQAIRSEEELHRAWDILVASLFIYLEKTFFPPTKYREAIKTLFEGYAEILRLPDWTLLKNIIPLVVLLPPPYRKIVRDSLMESRG